MRKANHDPATAPLGNSRKPAATYGQTLFSVLILGAGMKVHSGPIVDLAATTLFLGVALSVLIGLGLVLEPVASAAGASE
ncbi:hypothetical protein ACLGGT_21880 [Roseovarius sp. MS2]|uniref:hypothetical protein n=1 Tax=Roseovarius sp. MS2 TaxID=3390728 RepID=UPI003EDB76DF